MPQSLCSPVSLRGAGTAPRQGEPGDALLTLCCWHTPHGPCSEGTEGRCWEGCPASSVSRISDGDRMWLLGVRRCYFVGPSTDRSAPPTERPQAQAPGAVPSPRRMASTLQGVCRCVTGRPGHCLSSAGSLRLTEDWGRGDSGGRRSKVARTTEQCTHGLLGRVLIPTGTHLPTHMHLPAPGGAVPKNQVWFFLQEDRTEVVFPIPLIK